MQGGSGCYTGQSWLGRLGSWMGEGVGWFFDHLNSVHLNAQFTKEMGRDNHLPFLDIAYRWPIISLGHVNHPSNRPQVSMMIRSTLREKRYSQKQICWALCLPVRTTVPSENLSSVTFLLSKLPSSRLEECWPGTKALDCFPGLPAAFILWRTTSSWRPQVHTASHVDVVRPTLGGHASPLGPGWLNTRHIWPGQLDKLAVAKHRCNCDQQHPNPLSNPVTWPDHLEGDMRPSSIPTTWMQRMAWQ